MVNSLKNNYLIDKFVLKTDEVEWIRILAFRQRRTKHENFNFEKLEIFPKLPLMNYGLWAVERTGSFDL